MFAHADCLVAEPLASPVRTVADGQEIFPGVQVRITAGRTAGHAEFTITGGGTRLIAFVTPCIHRSRWTTLNGLASTTMTLPVPPTTAAVSSPSWKSPTRSASASTSPTSCSGRSDGTATAPPGARWTYKTLGTTGDNGHRLRPTRHVAHQILARHHRSRADRDGPGRQTIDVVWRF